MNRDRAAPAFTFALFTADAEMIVALFAMRWSLLSLPAQQRFAARPRV